MRDVVVQRDGLVEAVVGQHVQDRRERLRPDDVGLLPHPHDRRLDVGSGGRLVHQPRLPAGQNLAAVGLHPLQR